MSELELKLLVAADDLGRAQSALAAMAGRPRAARTTLTSTYYDTPELTLRRNDLELRVRKEGRRFIQTVKANGLAGDDLAARGEWEDPVRDGVPDLAAPESGAHLLPALDPAALRPLFTTVVQRTRFDLSPKPGSRIEVAIDRGDIRLVEGDAAKPIHEVELELREGDPVVVWDVALRLLEIVPFRIGTLGKAERGYRLVSGGKDAPPVVHAQPIRLHRRMTVDEALRVMGQRSLAMLMRNEEAALASVPGGIHQMRVTVRRLRAVLSAVKPLLPEEHFRWANGELKWLGSSLGPARSWDVFAASLLEPVSHALGSDRDLARLATGVERQRRGAYARARETILSPRYTATMLRLARWFEARGWRDQPVSEQSARLVAPIGAEAPALLARVHRKAMKRARHFAALTPPERHKLRIALKKLRYTVEFLESLFAPREIRRYVKRVKPLQDDLGHANDVRTAPALVAELRNGGEALERAGGVVLGWHDRGLAEAEARTLCHVRRFRRARPFW
ncbi:MAG TPA: CHAD domain-containing protein [Stellaceae bacterium]|nr:CHAD domain-containing protein [Stellaceae bacterium]